MTFQPHLATRMKYLSASPTLELTARAKALAAQGLDIISLAAGEPDLQPPSELIDALKSVAQWDVARGYTSTEGLLELRKAIAQWLARQRNLLYEPQDILVTPGCKMAIFQSLFCLTNQDDEVVIGAPYWVSYPQMILACQATPIYVQTTSDSKFLLNADNLAPHLSHKTKAIILGNPHNPTGQCYSSDELLALGILLRKYPQVVVICDDIYDSLMSDSIHFLQLAPDLADRVIVINGISKSMGLTGWRMGFAAGPRALIAAMTLIQSQTLTCVAAPIQLAAIKAYNLDHQQELFQKNAQIYLERAKVFAEKMTQIRSLKVYPTQAGFYSWVDASLLISELKLQNDWELAERILKEALVACIPGSSFGAPGFLRFSLTVSEDRLIEAVQRLIKIYGQGS
jgi:aspartate aminotransferase